VCEGINLPILLGTDQLRPTLATTKVRQRIGRGNTVYGQENDVVVVNFVTAKPRASACFSAG